MGMTLLAEAAAAETAKFYGIVNIDASTIVFTLINTLIIVLLYRFLLHKKVMQILDERNKKVNADIQAAADANAEAQQIKEEYTEKLRTSKEEAQQIVAAAVKKAGVRESEIIAAAEEEAAKIRVKAEESIALEKKKAVNEIKDEISEMVIMAASKVAEKEISAKDNEELINSFLADVGKE